MKISLLAISFLILISVKVQADDLVMKPSVKTQLGALALKSAEPRPDCTQYETDLKKYPLTAAHGLENPKDAPQALVTLTHGPETPAETKKARLLAAKSAPSALSDPWFSEDMAKLKYDCALQQSHDLYRALLVNRDAYQLTREQLEQLKDYGVRFAKEHSSYPSNIVPTLVSIRYLLLLSEQGFLDDKVFSKAAFAKLSGRVIGAQKFLRDSLQSKELTRKEVMKELKFSQDLNHQIADLIKKSKL
jgi:hypothetical protein